MASSDAGVPKPPGVDFDETLKRLTRDLKEADHSLLHARLSQGTLEEASEALDHIRSTIWAALNSMVDEFSSADVAPTVLTAHRLQRARALMVAIIGEIDVGRVGRETVGLNELCTVLGVAYKKLNYVASGKAAPLESA